MEYPLHKLNAGGVFMCRRNHLWGFSLIAFGLGLIVGLCLESGFFCSFLGVGVITLGFWCMGRK